MSAGHSTDAASAPAVSISNLQKRYGATEALSSVTFEVGAGQIFGLLGLNGAGKTTTLECIVGLRQSHESGLSIGQLFEHIFKGARKTEVQESPIEATHGKKIDFLTPVPTGFPSADPPRIGSVQFVDLDKDGLPDILVADMLANRVGWIRQFPAGVYTEKWISPVLPAPAHVSAFDIHKDGDLDVPVARMGQLFPSNDKIGSVVILENDGRQNFTPHTIIDHVARVTDVRAADFNGVGRHGNFKSHLVWGSTNEDYGSSGIRPVDLNQDGPVDSRKCGRRSSWGRSSRKRSNSGRAWSINSKTEPRCREEWSFDVQTEHDFPPVGVARRRPGRAGNGGRNPLGRSRDHRYRICPLRR